MPKCRSNIRLTVSPSACILAAMLILLLPLRWVFAAIFAAAFHEACHVLAVYLCGGTVRRICVGNRGAVIRADALPTGKELICILAGPIGSLLLVLFVRWIPRIALCGLFHAFYNLLPIYPLDGGRALRCIWLALKNRP